MKLLLYRHGEILLPGNEKSFAGRTDYPLSAAGMEQIRCSAREYKGDAEQIYVSPSLRCRQSGAIFQEVLEKRYNRKVEMVVEEDLMEINMGEWDGRTFAEIKEQYPREYVERGRNLPDYRVPGGETFAEVQQRAVRTIRDIAEHTKKEAVLITHLGVIRTLRCYLENQPLTQMFDWRLDYGKCLILDSIP